MRLVALAEIGSSPVIIRMGKDTAEPDDAAVLRKPQANPAPTPSTKDHTSYSSQAGIISLSLTPSRKSDNDRSRPDQLLSVPLRRPMHIAALQERVRAYRRSAFSCTTAGHSIRSTHSRLLERYFEPYVR